MARKKRDYKAEYRRRIARGKAKGLSRSQARGHPATGEAYISRKRKAKSKQQPDLSLEAAIEAIRAGASLTAAAKRQRVSRERLSRYAKKQAGAEYSGRSWSFSDTRTRQVPILATGYLNPQTIKVVGYETASEIGRHYHEAERVVEDHELVPLFKARWSGKIVEDAKGRQFELATSINLLHRLLLADEVDWTKIYQLQVP